MVWLLRCENITVVNVVLHDSMCWTLHPEECDHVQIRNVIIDENRYVANTDGIDLSGCSHVEADQLLYFLFEVRAC